MSYNIGIIGTGYVGLVSGVVFAATGNKVWCIDVDDNKINMLNQGICPIFEPGLEVLLKQVLNEKAIVFSNNLEIAVENSLLIFLCLPTPPNEDGSADLQHVLKITRQVAEIIKEKNINTPKIIVNKSTVPVGTAEKVRQIINSIIPEKEIYIASNPEFLREGFAVEDSMKPDRIIIGCDHPYVEEIMRDLYQPFVRSGNPIIVMDIKSAEVTKYAANAFLATKISFMNDLSEFCERVGVDIENVRIGIGADSRIGKRFLFAGLGYGGSCFPKDVKALIYSGEAVGTPLMIVSATAKVNEKQITRFINNILRRFNYNVENLKFAIWGLSFKPNTDDIREAPSLKVIDALLERKGLIHCFDPEAMQNVKNKYGEQLQYANSKYDCLEDADCLIIVTEWNTFRNPDFEKMKILMKQPIIFDGRNLYDLKEIEKLGFEYYSIGRRYINSKL